VDIDTFDEDLPKWVHVFLKERGDLNKLTVSSDSGINSPHTLHQQITAALRELKQPLETLLPLVTSNTARVLKLFHKGRVAIGCDADLVILERESLTIRHLISRGQVMVRDGIIHKQESSMEQSNRRILLEGRKP
jgi:beta-aspartyl-dipeptidase (metallo-type)